MVIYIRLLSPQNKIFMHLNVYTPEYIIFEMSQNLNIINVSILPEIKLTPWDFYLISMYIMKVQNSFTLLQPLSCYIHEKPLALILIHMIVVLISTWYEPRVSHYLGVMLRCYIIRG